MSTLVNKSTQGFGTTPGFGTFEDFGTALDFKTPQDFWTSTHAGLTRVRSIWFLLFKILVYNSTIFKLTDLFISYFSFKIYMPTKKYLRKKVKQLYLMGQIVIELFWIISKKNVFLSKYMKKIIKSKQSILL